MVALPDGVELRRGEVPGSDRVLNSDALAFVARPVGLAPLLAPMRLRLGEKLFIAWGGLKGAV